MSVEVDLSKLEQRFSEKGMKAAHELLASKVAEYCDKYVPYDTGALHDHRFVVEGGKVIEWQQDYAKAVYNMDHVLTVKNKNAAPHWFEVAKRNHLQEWIDYAKKECF